MLHLFAQIPNELRSTRTYVIALVVLVHVTGPYHNNRREKGGHVYIWGFFLLLISYFLHLLNCLLSVTQRLK